MRRMVTLEIAGSRYRMSAEAEDGHLESLAEVVNERVKALTEKAGRPVPAAQLLAMVALGLADDLQMAEVQRERVEEMTRSVVRGAIQRIDSLTAAEPNEQPPVSEPPVSEPPVSEPPLVLDPE